MLINYKRELSSRRFFILQSVLSFLPIIAKSDVLTEKLGSLIVNASPGTSPDIFGRNLATFIKNRAGINLSVENFQGAGGLIAVQQLLKNSTDKPRLLLANSGLICNLPISSKEKIFFNPQKDFEPIAIMASVPFFLVTNPDSGIQNMAEIKGKKNIQYAISSIGSAGHIAGEMLCSQFNVNSQPIPYSSNSQATLDIATNRISFGIFSWKTISPMLDKSKLIPLCSFSSTRSRFAPNIKTASEQGFKNLQIEGWQGLFAPPNVSSEIVKYYNQLISEWVEEKNYLETLFNCGYNFLFHDSFKSQHFINLEILRYQKLINKYKIKISEL